MESGGRDYYALLHVDRNAPVEVIRASYRALMQQLRGHPDLGGDHETAALLNAAYAVLKHPKSRAAYDAELAFEAERRQDPRHPHSHQAAAADESPSRRWAEPPESSLSDTAAWAFNSSAAVLADPCVFCGLGSGTNAGDANGICVRCRSPLSLVPRQPGSIDSKRSVHRVAKNARLKVYSHWQDRQAKDGIYMDLSLTGLRFALPERLDPQQLIRVESAICGGVARVAHCVPIENSHNYIVGAEFLTVQFKQQRGSLLSVPA